jgi:hypothetical protein
VLGNVVDERAHQGGELLARAIVRGDRRGEQVAQLVQVTDEGEREVLLLAGELPVDDGQVDADRLRDVLDLGVADPVASKSAPVASRISASRRRPDRRPSAGEPLMPPHCTEARTVV